MTARATAHHDQFAKIGAKERLSFGAGTQAVTAAIQRIQAFQAGDGGAHRA